MAFGAAMDQQPNYATAGGGQTRQRHYGGSGFTSPNADDFSTTSSNYYPPYSEMPFTSLKRRKQQQDFQLVKWAMRFVLASPVLVIVCWTIGAMLFHTSSNTVVPPAANKSTSRQLHKQQQQGPRRGAATGHNNNNNNPNKITTGYMLPNGGMPPMMMMPANANVPPGYMMVMVPQTQQGGEPQQQQQQLYMQQQQHQYHQNGIPVIAPMGSTNSNAASTTTTTTTIDNVAPHPMIVQPHLQTMQQQQDYPQVGQQQQLDYPPQMGQQEQVQAMGQQQQQQQAQPMGVAASAMIASPLSQQQQQAAEVVPLDPMTSTSQQHQSQQQSGRSHPRPHPLPRAAEPYYDDTTTTTGQEAAAVATPMKQQVLYYDPNHLETNSQGQYQLPSVVYDQDGNQVDLSTFQQQSTPIYMEPPTRKTLQMPQNLGEIQQWGASTAQDQGIIVATVAVMALLVGALSARRMRSRSVLSACIENESLEDDVAYDTAYTTHLGGQDRNAANHNGSSMGGAAGNTYNTFGGWKGDLEKFDV